MNHRGEFPEIKTATDFAEHIDRIIAALTESRNLNHAREAWAKCAGGAIICDPCQLAWQVKKFAGL